MEESSKFHTVRGYQRLEKQDNQLTSAMEDYLEMIYRNILEEGYMRVNTLSELLNVAAPSATKMVQNLSKLGYINYKRYGIILLTEQGKNRGKYLLNRHNSIAAFLRNLGVEKEILADTELIEHDISEATLEAIQIFNQFFKQNPEVAQNYDKFKQTYKE